MLSPSSRTLGLAGRRLPCRREEKTRYSKAVIAKVGVNIMDGDRRPKADYASLAAGTGILATICTNSASAPICTSHGMVLMCGAAWVQAFSRRPASQSTGLFPRSSLVDARMTSAGFVPCAVVLDEAMTRPFATPFQPGGQIPGNRHVRQGGQGCRDGVETGELRIPGQPQSDGLIGKMGCISFSSSCA